MKRIIYVGMDGIRRSAIYYIKKDVDSLNRSSILNEIFCEKLNAKYIVRFEEV